MTANCDVCSAVEQLYTRCSATGAVSFAYCLTCLESGREPYGAVIASLVILGAESIEEVAEWYRPVIEITAHAAGKAISQLFEDVKKQRRQYIREQT